MKFKEYLQQQINKPEPEWFDPNGNSSRATIARGKFGGFIYECKKLLPSLKSDLIYYWDGFDTPISYFFQIMILPFILPILPFLRAFYSYKRATKEYKREYESKGIEK